MATSLRWPYKLAIFACLIFGLVFTFQPEMSTLYSSALVAALLPGVALAAVDLNWYAPAQTDINNITDAFDSEGVYGFIFNTSDTPADEYGTYNWCNMPHVRKEEYVKPSADYTLKYVEVVSALVMANW
jgi:2-phosphoxylose phosphatase